MKNKIYLLFLVLIGTLYIVLRLFDIESKMTFHLDQGLQLAEAKSMVDTRKITLIGPMVTTKTFEGRAFFIGPFYTYILAVYGLLTDWNPLSVIVLASLVELISTIIFLVWLGKKYSPSASLMVFFVVSITPFLIEHSRFYWNPHFLLPLSYLLIYFLENKKYFLSAIVLGLGFSFHYSACLWALPILYYLLKNREKFQKYLVFIPGFILGDLPFFVFELKHQFYNFKTMFLVFTNTNKASEISAYYFVFPFFAFLIFILIKNYKKNKTFFFSVLSLIIAFNIFYHFKLAESIPVGMPIGWNYPTQKRVINLIMKNSCPVDFNIATTIGGDTRSYDLRYLLNINKCLPNSVDNYPQSSTIYLIAPSTRPPETETVWEISSFKPFKVTEKIIINDNVIFYRLDKSKAIL